MLKLLLGEARFVVLDPLLDHIEVVSPSVDRIFGHPGVFFHLLDDLGVTFLIILQFTVHCRTIALH